MQLTVDDDVERYARSTPLPESSTPAPSTYIEPRRRESTTLSLAREKSVYQEPKEAFVAQREASVLSLAREITIHISNSDDEDDNNGDDDVDNEAVSLAPAVYHDPEAPPIDLLGVTPEKTTGSGPLPLPAPVSAHDVDELGEVHAAPRRDSIYIDESKPEKKGTAPPAPIMPESSFALSVAAAEVHESKKKPGGFTPKGAPALAGKAKPGAPGKAKPAPAKPAPAKAAPQPTKKKPEVSKPNQGKGQTKAQPKPLISSAVTDTFYMVCIYIMATMPEW